MPDENGKLSIDEQDKVMIWIGSRVKGCPLCKEKNLSVGNQLIAPVPINPQAKMVQETTYPMVTLTCRKCFAIYFVNVTALLELKTR